MASSGVLVSVCVASYNYERFLAQAIQSVLDQTVTDLEVIVCDDQSTDNSLEIARSFRDPRVQVHLNESRLGIYGNFTRGASFARGKYIKFLCVDDWLEPTYLEATLPYFERYPNVGLVTVRQNVVDEANRLVHCRLEPVEGKDVYDTTELLDASLHRSNPLGNPTRVILRRDIFDELGGFDLTNEFSSELDLWLRVAIQYDVAAVTAVHCTERSHSGQATNSYRRQAKDIRDICRAYQKNIEQFPAYWTLERRAALCRNALRPYVRQGIRQSVRGNTAYWKMLDEHISKICPRQYWLPYYLFVGPLSIAEMKLRRAGKQLIGSDRLSRLRKRQRLTP